MLITCETLPIEFETVWMQEQEGSVRSRSAGRQDSRPLTFRLPGYVVWAVLSAQTDIWPISEYDQISSFIWRYPHSQTMFTSATITGRGGKNGRLRWGCQRAEEVIFVNVHGPASRRHSHGDKLSRPLSILLMPRDQAMRKRGWQGADSFYI